jgi:hypothetical protein
VRWAKAHEREENGKSEPLCHKEKSDALGSQIYSLENGWQNQNHKFIVNEMTEINDRLMDVIVSLYSLVDSTPQVGADEVLIFFSAEDRDATIRLAKHKEWRFVRGLKNCELIKEKMLYQVLAERKANKNDVENFIKEYK